MILEGGLAANAPLSERKLAESLNVGRTPVREALRSLARDGVVEVRPARGTFVRQFSANDMREIYQVRQPLEGLAARLAAENGPTPELEAYGAAFRETIDDLDSVDLKRTHDHGAAFHLEVFRAAANGYLLKTYEPMRLKFGTAMRLPRHFDHDRVRTAVSEHLDIYEAIERGDGDGAERYMCAHLAQGLTARIRIFKDLAERESVEEPAA